MCREIVKICLSGDMRVCVSACTVCVQLDLICVCLPLGLRAGVCGMRVWVCELLDTCDSSWRFL